MPTEAIMRRTGALVALCAAAVLVPLLVLFPKDEALKLGVLPSYAVVLLGCAGVLFSPAQRAVAELARWAADAAGEIFSGAPWRADAETWYESAAAVRGMGTLVALAMASALLLPLMPDPAFVASKGMNRVVLALYAVFMVGCAAVLLSPAYHALVRRAAEATREILGAPWRAAAVRSLGALVALAAASALLLLLTPVPPFVASKNVNGVVLALYAVFMLGCAAVLLSPAYPAMAAIARRAARYMPHANATGRAAAVLRWGGFTCICTVFCTICAVGTLGGVSSEAAAATAVVSSLEQFGCLALFALFLAAVWTVLLSLVTGQQGPPTLPVQSVQQPLPPLAPEDGHEGGGGNCAVHAELLRGVDSKV